MYAQATSPIRRYVDLLVHYQIKVFLVHIIQKNMLLLTPGYIARRTSTADAKGAHCPRPRARGKAAGSRPPSGQLMLLLNAIVLFFILPEQLAEVLDPPLLGTTGSGTRVPCPCAHGAHSVPHKRPRSRARFGL